jgi:hypothetical protein
MPQVTRLAATAEAEPEDEPIGDRSVSYGLLQTPLKDDRGTPDAYSPMVDLARMIAPAARSLVTKVASAGGLSSA